MKYSEKFTVVSQNLDYNEAPKSIRGASGGCIHDASVWEFHDGKRFFVKYAPNNEKAEMLLAEYRALQLIHQSESVRCPTPLFFEQVSQQEAVLVMEFLELRGLDSSSGSKLGRLLATLHQNTSECFGLDHDNYIGATPQKNNQTENWAEFFWNQRLLFQLRLAEKNGYPVAASEKLESASNNILKTRQSIKPALLHGDLWGGNAGALPDGTPVIFDPACYYGDPETDLAFTEVFGGFPPDFYRAYGDMVAPSEGYQERKVVYNLYHYLNHLNLFGSGYLSTCERMIHQLVTHHR